MPGSIPRAVDEGFDGSAMPSEALPASSIQDKLLQSDQKTKSCTAIILELAFLILAAESWDHLLLVAAFSCALPHTVVHNMHDHRDQRGLQMQQVADAGMMIS